MFAGLGILLIILGIIFLVISVISLALQGKSKGNTKIEVGVGGFIGPVPFGFFTSKKMFWLWLGILLIGIIIFILTKYFMR